MASEDVERGVGRLVRRIGLGLLVLAALVAWQGLTATKAPDATLTCAQGLYGDEKLRRVISIPVRLANLN